MIRTIFEFLARKLAARRVRARVSWELSTYSERDLADMGLRREDIGRIARDSQRSFERAALVRTRHQPASLAQAQTR
jgi:uncharacterized protein YjiS (DUF1127 family)